jgi:hypothetical protein
MKHVLLVELPKGSEYILAEAVGLRRVAVLGIDVSSLSFRLALSGFLTVSKDRRLHSPEPPHSSPPANPPAHCSVVKACLLKQGAARYTIITDTYQAGQNYRSERYEGREGGKNQTEERC